MINKHAIQLLICTLLPIFFILSTSCSVYGAEAAYLVKDTKQNTPIVKHWRIAEVYPQQQPLWASGSAVPSFNGWQTIKATILETTHNQAKTIIDVDLRQENHGYLNHDAIELETSKNWRNLGKTREQALQDEEHWLEQLRQQKMLKNILTAKQYKLGHLNKGHSITVKSVEDEKTIVEKLGFSYFRLTVPDHMAPDNQDVDRFIELVRTLKPNTWLHIHCRGGDGRTTTFMTMYDMLRHGKQLSYSDFIVREAKIIPYYNLLKSSRHYAQPFAVRVKFLEKFYRYAQAYSNGYAGNWSRWLTENKLD